MHRRSLATLLATFAVGAYIASSWPDLTHRYEQRRKSREEEEAAPETSRLDIYSSLGFRLFRVSRSADPYEVLRATSAASRCLSTPFDPLSAVILHPVRERNQHVSRIVLGRAALLANDVDCAECDLLASVAPLSPPQYRWHFFAPLPDMTLAQELLVRGRSSVVLQYLEACKPVWPIGEPDRLSAWRANIESGAMPDFQRWSAYSAAPNPGMQRTRYARR